MTDVAFSNAQSGVALGYKMHSLEQYSVGVDRVFKKGLLRLWELITNRINLKNNTAYDFRNINILFNRNAPTDKERDMGMAIRGKDSGIVSHKTAIKMTGVEVDAGAEIAQIEAEKLQISDVQQVIDLKMAGLIDEVTASEKLYGPEQGKMVADRLAMEQLAVGVPTIEA